MGRLIIVKIIEFELKLSLNKLFVSLIFFLRICKDLWKLILMEVKPEIVLSVDG